MLRSFTLGLAALLSLSFSLLFWSSLASGPLQVLFLLLAIILEATKCLAWQQCQQAYASQRIAALLASGSLFLLLFLISISATTLQLQASYQQQREHQLIHSSQYQSLDTQIQQQQSLIATLLANAQHDTEHGFRARAQELLKHELIEAQTLLSSLREAQQAHRQNPSTPLGALSGWGGLAAERLELILCLVLGSLLDIVLAFLLWLKHADSKTCSLMLQTTAPEPLRHSRHLKTAPHKTLSVSKEYEEVKQLLMSKRCLPAIRTIKAIARVGTKKAQNYLSTLEREGFLVRKNLRYRLINA